MFIDILFGFIWNWGKSRIKKWRQPECPRWAMGYKCNESKAGGCVDCGRGQTDAS